MRIAVVVAAASFVSFASLTLASCAADNPFDPNTPSDAQQPARVAGTVVDSDGPVKDATVAIGDVSVVTGDDGAYVLAQVAPGVVTLVVDHVAHQQFVRDLVLIAGENRTVDVALIALGEDAGHIKGVARKATEVDEDVPDFSGIIVAVESAGVRTVTNAAGDYDVRIAPGTYDLTLSAVDHVAQVVPAVVVTGNTPTVVDTVTLAANPGSVSGTVTLADLVPGTAVHGGVVVTVGAATTTTGSDDTFQITGLAPGAAVVRYTRDGYDQAEQLVVVKAGQLTAIDDVNLVLATGDVAGTVDVAGTLDDSGVTVALAGASGTFAATSAPDGSFHVSSVPAGTYNVDASRAGFITGSAVVVVVADATVVLSDVLTLSPEIASVVVNGGAAFTNDADVTVSIASNVAPARMLLSEDPTFPAGAGTIDAVFAATSTFTLDAGAGDGLHTIFVELTDDAGAVVSSLSASITLDTTAPVLGATSGNANDAVLADFDAAFTNSVSVTVTFDVDGADEVAVAVDGTVDSEPFQTFSQFLTVLLPSNECAAGDVDCRTVCAVFRDEAGNTSGPICDGISLDTTVPAAPLIVEDDTVIPTAVEGDADAAFTLHLVDDVPDINFDHYELLLAPGSPVFTTVTPGASVAGELPIDLTLLAKNTGDPQLDAQTNIVRVRAVDAAGNVSPESAVTIVVDSRAPDAPVLAGAPPALNDSTVSVNFRPDENLADKDATFDHYSIKTSLLPEPFDSFQRDGIVVTLKPNETNTIDVVAVDAAGNRSLPSSITVVHDDQAPFAPSISPTDAVARGAQIEVALLIASLDPPGNDNPGDPPQAVSRYQLKDGFGQGFKDVGDGVTGVFVAKLKKNRDNEICVRGVDAAGNIGIEECATVHEETQETVADTDENPHGSDIAGDVLVFNGSGEHPVVRDLSGSFPEFQIGEQELTAAGDIHLGGGDGTAIVGVWSNRSGNTASEVVLFVGDGFVLPGQSPPTQKGVFLGQAPSTDGLNIAYVQGGRVRVRPAFPVPPDFTAGGQLDPNPGDLGTDVSGAVTLCNGTEPRIGGGVVIWCQDPGPTGNPRALMRHVVADGASQARNAQLAKNLDVIRDGSLVGGGGGSTLQQPQVSSQFIAWASADGGAGGIGAGLAFIDISGDALATTPTVASAFVPDQLNDITGADVVDVHKTADGLTNDIVAVRIGIAPQILGGTSDPSPQGDAAADGTNAVFQDTSIGETIEHVDLSSTRWIMGASQFAFEPVTSSQATAWVQGFGSRIALVARRVPVDGAPTIVVDDPLTQFAFFGPAHADPTYAIGGTRVAFITSTGPGLFSLLVRDIADNRITLVSTHATPVLALDPDGDELVFVDDTNNVQRALLPAQLQATTTASPVVLAGSGPIIFVDVDNGMIVAQRGGDPSDETQDQGTGTPVCAQGGVTGVIPIGNVRGPRVAQLANGAFQFAAMTRRPPGFARAGTCSLTCSASPACNNGTFAGNVGNDFHVEIGRDGRVVFLNDAVGLTQIEQFDVFTKARVHLTKGSTERSGATVADGRVVYSDPSLGGFGVFEIVTP